MNENIDLTKILKDCPKGTEFYSSVYGNVTFQKVDDSSVDYEEIIIYHDYGREILDKYGVLFDFRGNGECILFPSKDQRNWSKFKAPWLNKPKFDPKTLKAYDKVLVSDTDGGRWKINIFSHISNSAFPYRCIVDFYERCIPYNDDTKHLLGTKEVAPEYYRYWED